MEANNKPTQNAAQRSIGGLITYVPDTPALSKDLLFDSFIISMDEARSFNAAGFYNINYISSELGDYANRSALNLVGVTAFALMPNLSADTRNKLIKWGLPDFQFRLARDYHENLFKDKNGNLQIDKKGNPVLTIGHLDENGNYFGSTMNGVGIDISAPAKALVKDMQVVAGSKLPPAPADMDSAVPESKKKPMDTTAPASPQPQSNPTPIPDRAVGMTGPATDKNGAPEPTTPPAGTSAATTGGSSSTTETLVTKLKAATGSTSSSASASGSGENNSPYVLFWTRTNADGTKEGVAILRKDMDLVDPTNPVALNKFVQSYHQAWNVTSGKTGTLDGATVGSQNEGTNPRGIALRKVLASLTLGLVPLSHAQVKYLQSQDEKFKPNYFEKPWFSPGTLSGAIIGANGTMPTKTPSKTWLVIREVLGYATLSFIPLSPSQAIYVSLQHKAKIVAQTLDAKTGGTANQTAIENGSMTPLQLATFVSDGMKDPAIAQQVQDAGSGVNYFWRPWGSSKLGLSDLNKGANFGFTMSGFLTNDVLHPDANKVEIEKLNLGLIGKYGQDRTNYINEHATDYKKAGAISIFDGSQEVTVGTAKEGEGIININNGNYGIIDTPFLLLDKALGQAKEHAAKNGKTLATYQDLNNALQEILKSNPEQFKAITDDPVNKALIASIPRILTANNNGNTEIGPVQLKDLEAMAAELQPNEGPGISLLPKKFLLNALNKNLLENTTGLEGAPTTNPYLVIDNNTVNSSAGVNGVEVVPTRNGLFVSAPGNQGTEWANAIPILQDEATKLGLDPLLVIGKGNTLGTIFSAYDNFYDPTGASDNYTNHKRTNPQVPNGTLVKIGMPSPVVPGDTDQFKIELNENTTAEHPANKPAWDIQSLIEGKQKPPILILINWNYPLLATRYLFQMLGIGLYDSMNPENHRAERCLECINEG